MEQKQFKRYSRPLWKEFSGLLTALSIVVLIMGLLLCLKFCEMTPKQTYCVMKWQSNCFEEKKEVNNGRK